MDMTKQKPSIGRTVHYYLGDVDLVGGESHPQYRPATVVNIFPGSDTVQLQVLLDGTNDRNVVRDDRSILAVTIEEAQRGTAWRTSVPEGETIGTWRWPPRS